MVVSISEFAFSRSRSSTTLGTMAMFAGAKSAVRHASTAEPATTAGKLSCPDQARPARARVTKARARSHAIINGLRGQRSARAPATGPSSTAGSVVAIKTAPVAASEPVAWIVHHMSASWCTRSPRVEDACASHSRAKAALMKGPDRNDDGLWGIARGPVPPSGTRGPVLI
ncbi:hypothetical protein D3C72_1607910 [compost metagenome]